MRVMAVYGKQIAEYKDGDFFIYKTFSKDDVGRKSVRYTFGYSANPDLHFEEWEHGLLLYCKDIPVQEFKSLGHNWLSENARERWNTWGIDEYGITFDEMRKVDQYCKWCPQGGINSHNVYGGSQGYSLSSVKNEIDLRRKYDGLDHIHFQFYDEELTSTYWLKQTGTPSSVAFNKKYGVTDKLKKYLEKSEQSQSRYGIMH